MALSKKQQVLGMSDSEMTVYLALFKNNPINGSQLSKLSSVPRTRIYDILRDMKRKGMVMELANGQFVPLPPEELIKRMRSRYESELQEFEEMLQNSTQPETYDYFWTLHGYGDVMTKSKEMIATAQQELYVLLFPEEALELDAHLQAAEKRGVVIKYVSMGIPRTAFTLQVVHPDSDAVRKRQQGRVFDIVKDKEEILVGLFKKGQEDRSSINWARNHWFVMAIREGVRHDFFHCFMEKMVDRGEELTADEKSIYDIIKNDV